MNTISRLPAVRRLATDRGDLLAVDIVGTMTAADVENFLGLIDGMLELSPAIDLLIRVTDLDTMEGSADDDTVASIRNAESGHVTRLAAIGHPAGLGLLRAIVSRSAPADHRTFEAAQEAEAWNWLGATRLTAAA